LFQKALAEDDVNNLIKSLERQGLVTVTGTKVTYSFPD